METGKLPQSAMSFNLVGSPFASMADAVEIRFAEVGGEGETNPCASFFASLQTAGSMGPNISPSPDTNKS